MDGIEEQLRELMIKKCGSVNKFADYIGMPQSTVGNILRRGVNNSSITNIIKICKALGISTDKLAEGKIVETKDKIRKEISKNIFVSCVDDVFFAEEKENLYKMRKLNKEGKRYVVKQIDYALQQDEYIIKKEDSKEA